MKFPHIRSLGREDGWYRVGPLAQLNCCAFIDTPIAEAARKEFMALGHGGLVHATLAYHWARLICMIHCAETIKDLLFDDDLQGTDLVVTGERRPEGVAIIEAPRGTLLHHYTVDDNDQVTGANLIVSTTNNNEAMNRSVTKVAMDDLTGHEITEGLLNHIEVAIRAYDPCLSCATHALGDMPLIVTLEDADGAVIATQGEAMSVPDQRRLRANRASSCSATAIPGARTTDSGPAAAAEIESLGWPNVTAFDNYQLNIEDAMDVAEHDVVWFVDAAKTGPSPYAVRDVSPVADHRVHQPHRAARDHPRHRPPMLRRVAAGLPAGHPRLRIRVRRGADAGAPRTICDAALAMLTDRIRAHAE